MSGIVEEVVRDHETVSEIGAIRDTMVANFGCSARVAGGQILALMREQASGQALREERVTFSREG